MPASTASGPYCDAYDFTLRSVMTSPPETTRTGPEDEAVGGSAVEPPEAAGVFPALPLVPAPPPDGGRLRLRRRPSGDPGDADAGQHDHDDEHAERREAAQAGTPAALLAGEPAAPAGVR